MTTLHHLPDDLPAPLDDSACDHLPGMDVAAVSLAATTGGSVDLSALRGRTVVFCYPRTGQPGQAAPTDWDMIPGARGCTPQACSFRDLHADLTAHHVAVYGISTQETAYQQEAAERLHLPYPLLSDANLAFASAMRLPTFHADGMTLLKRATLIIRDGVVEHVFYPVFPPDRDAATVLAWLASQEQHG